MESTITHASVRKASLGPIVKPKFLLAMVILASMEETAFQMIPHSVAFVLKA